MKFSTLITLALGLLIQSWVVIAGVSKLAEDVVSVDVKYVDNVVHLLIGKQVEGKDSVWYKSSSDQGVSWSSPVNITAGMDIETRVRRGNDARLAVQGDDIVAVWMTKREGNRHKAGPMMAMASKDAGKTWQEIKSPADWDGPHGFFAIDASDQKMALVWLDSRKKVGDGATQGLRYSESVDGGQTWSVNQTLDERSCACCWNTARYHNDELYVLYRDKDPSDMTLGKLSKDVQWHDLGTVGAFNWDFKGCPHIGGSVAFDGENGMIHSTVGTGHSDHTGIYYLKSADMGKSWQAPVRFGSDTSVHSDMDAHQDTVVMVWDSITETGFEVSAAYSDNQGETWSAPAVLSPPGFRSGHPRVITMADKALVFWTEGKEKQGNSLRMMALPVQ